MVWLGWVLAFQWVKFIKIQFLQRTSILTDPGFDGLTNEFSLFALLTVQFPQDFTIVAMVVPLKLPPSEAIMKMMDHPNIIKLFESFEDHRTIIRCCAWWWTLKPFSNPWMQDTRMHASEQRLLLAHMSSRITESRMTCIPFSAKNSVQKRDGVGKNEVNDQI